MPRVSPRLRPFSRLVTTKRLYISETDFFREDWREAFWGTNYARLKIIKSR
jgi:Berberine and berberine like